MATMAMSKEERESFLAEAHVGVLSVARGAGEPPIAAPVWYAYEPGGDVVIVSGSTHEKTRCARENGYASMCAQTEELPYKFVTVEGTATVTEGAAPELQRALAHRYLGPELGDAYVESTAGETVAVIRITPQQWRTTDFAKM